VENPAAAASANTEEAAQAPNSKRKVKGHRRRVPAAKESSSTDSSNSNNSKAEVKPVLRKKVVESESTSSDSKETPREKPIDDDPTPERTNQLNNAGEDDCNIDMHAPEASWEKTSPKKRRKKEYPIEEVRKPLGKTSLQNGGGQSKFKKKTRRKLILRIVLIISASLLAVAALVLGLIFGLKTGKWSTNQIQNPYFSLYDATTGLAVQWDTNVPNGYDIINYPPTSRKRSENGLEYYYLAGSGDPPSPPNWTPQHGATVIRLTYNSTTSGNTTSSLDDSVAEQTVVPTSNYASAKAIKITACSYGEDVQIPVNELQTYGIVLSIVYNSPGGYEYIQDFPVSFIPGDIGWKISEQTINIVGDATVLYVTVSLELAIPGEAYFAYIVLQFL